MFFSMNPTKPHPRYWITRLYVALSTLVSAVIIVFEDEALVHKIVWHSGPTGMWCVVALALVALVAAADVVVNDLLPDRFVFEVAKRNRHLVYMALSMGLMSLCFVMTQSKGEWSQVTLRYQLDALVAATLAVLDLFSRHRGLHAFHRNHPTGFEPSAHEA